MHIETSAIQLTTHTDSEYGSIGTPLYQSSNFRFRAPGVSTGYDYTRSGNPTRATLETVLAELEGGATAVAVSTGMAAITTVLSHFPAGSHIICTHDCYGGTARLLNHYQTQGILDVSFVDLEDVRALEAAVTSNTRCLWIETPSNPLLRVVDLPALAEIAHRHDILVCVDNTFLSPYNFKPFAFGADIVVHSTTKWLNGHSDVVGGAVIAKERELGDRIYWLANALGVTTGSFDSWLVLRGIKTLGVRMRQHEENAHRVAEFLEVHPAVQEVFYPGRVSHATHETAAKLFDGFGGVISFRIAGGIEEAHRIIGSTTVFALAESLGGVESLIEHPATMSHASMGADLRKKAGITDDIIRISVGIEHIDDLLHDLDRALGAHERRVSITAPSLEEVVA
ncbi:MAG: PLP-dependent transferase [Bacteroidetes bacterium]|nr:PLP-dependent transferase [Bacteroidota bacterium]